MAGLLERFTDLIAERSASSNAAQIAAELRVAAGQHNDPVVRKSLGDESRNWASITEALRGIGQ